jgi:hypothetical protein
VRTSTRYKEKPHRGRRASLLEAIGRRTPTMRRHRDGIGAVAEGPPYGHIHATRGEEKS